MGCSCRMFHEKPLRRAQGGGAGADYRGGAAETKNPRATPRRGDQLEKGSGTTGRVSAQTLSMSQLLGWKWNSEKSIATGTHNSEPPSGRLSPAVADN
jgi:hypothetical protein